MALDERTFIDKIEVLVPTGHVQVRRATVVIREGREIARDVHRHVVRPGDDVTTEDPCVRRVVAAAWATDGDQ